MRVDDLGEQRFLAGEMAVQRFLRCARARGDHLHRRVSVAVVEKGGFRDGCELPPACFAARDTAARCDSGALDLQLTNPHTVTMRTRKFGYGRMASVLSRRKSRFAASNLVTSLCPIGR